MNYRLREKYTKSEAFLGAVRKVVINFVLSVRLSVRMEQLCFTGRIFVKFDFSAFFENLSKKCKFQ
jgi:hypothetical protein